ncbi:MAG TPA: hypothetical protein VGP93_20380 [Polyangiaceae bacterium]|jgi:hypothetical protein|nr:hypothetical protein [Polyangiaceae bacterium]
MPLDHRLVFAVLCALAPLGCVSSEPAEVLQVGSRNLRCPRAEMDAALNRQTPKVREYLVGCDFMYTRVHCSESGCYPAKVKPPCLAGTKAPCFKEDPVTLDWTLDQGIAEADVGLRVQEAPP